MKGWLVYASADRAHNWYFIDVMREVFAAADVEIEVKNSEEIAYSSFYIQYPVFPFAQAFLPGINGESGIAAEAGGQSAELPDFVINRSRDAGLAAAFEYIGRPVFNNSLVCSLGNDKIQAYEYLSELGIPMVASRAWSAGESAAEAVGAMCGKQVDAGVALDGDIDLVVKHPAGHGGAQVARVHSVGEAEAFRAGFPGQPLLLQKFANTQGRDLRLYVIGNRIVASVMRQAEQDFRANYAKGAAIQLCEPPREALDIAEQLFAALHFDYAAIDFIEDGGRLCLNEIEDAAGARMLYALGDSDILGDYARYLLRLLL